MVGGDGAALGDFPDGLSLLRALADNEFVLRVDAVDEMRVLENLHTLGNRLALSIVLAALIIGAAMLMQVETDFTILGYPGIAMLLFLMAAAGGFYLVIDILLKHAKDTKILPVSFVFFVSFVVQIAFNAIALGYASRHLTDKTNVL